MTRKKAQLYALLTAALVIASAPAISANIPAIAATFPTISSAWIDLFATIPALFIIVGIFLTGKIEQLIGSKNTMLLGLGFATVFGTLPAWYHGNFGLLFASRCLLGLGIGLFNRLLIQNISALTYTRPAEKARFLGLESAFEGLGGILMTLAVGQLVHISWQASFLVYGLAAIGFVMVALFVKETTGHQAKTRVETQMVSRATKKKMIGLTSLLFVIVSLFIVFNLQVTALLSEKHLGQATQGSNLIACISLGAFIAGNLFGTSYRILKGSILPVATMIAGLALIGISNSTSLTTIMILSGILGFAFRHIIPFFNHLFTSSGPAVARFGTTLIIMAYNLGSTCSPFLVKGLNALHIDQATTILTIAGSSFLAIGVLTACLIKHVQRI